MNERKQSVITVRGSKEDGLIVRRNRDGLDIMRWSMDGMSLRI